MSRILCNGRTNWRLASGTSSQRVPPRRTCKRFKHFGFVKPRWESFVAPRRRYVCLLRAIAHLLVLKAGDARHTPEIRASAQAALDALTPEDCFTAGVAGDYGEVCVEFLRAFHTSDMDPARLTPETAI